MTNFCKLLVITVLFGCQTVAQTPSEPCSMHPNSEAGRTAAACRLKMTFCGGGADCEKAVSADCREALRNICQLPEGDSK